MPIFNGNYTYCINVITPALFPHYIIENNLSVSCMKTGNVIEKIKQYFLLALFNCTLYTPDSCTVYSFALILYFVTLNCSLTFCGFTFYFSWILNILSKVINRMETSFCLAPPCSFFDLALSFLTLSP